jgi:hypothetical protein
MMKTGLGDDVHERGAKTGTPRNSSEKTKRPSVRA